MERFHYPSLAALYAESADLLYLMDCESYGYKMDERERMAEMEQEARTAEAQWQTK